MRRSSKAMRSRAWGLLIVIIILAAIVLTILLVWGGGSEPEPLTSTPTTGTSLPTSAIVASSSPTALPTETPTPAPLVYTVKAGDTLSGIAQTYRVSVQDIIEVNRLANPDILNVGQELIIPGHFITPTDVPPTEEASPTTASASDIPPPSLPTLTPSGPSVVEIWQVLSPNMLATETVIVHNRGGLASLEKWTLSDAEGNTFIFPALTLFTDGKVRVHSAAGENTPSDLYWGRASPAWHSGELMTLHDAGGNMVDTYIVP
jgi:LysM repeat protein